SIWIDVTAAPCKEESNTRRNALPSVRPKPRSSGSATITACVRGVDPVSTCSFTGLISSCPFFSITRGCPSAFKRGCEFCSLDAATLGRAAAVVRDRRHVANGHDGEARRLQRAKRALTARAGAGDFNLERPDAMLHRLLAGVFGRDLRRVGRRLAR